MTISMATILPAQPATTVADGMSSLRHLFIDDADIAKIERLTRTLHQPTKRGAVLKPDGPCVIQIRSAPMWVEAEQHYAMVYIASYPAPAPAGRFFATSKDGVKWEIPDLKRPPGPLTDFPNRILVHSDDPRWRGTDNVVIDPDEPDPARRYKALCGAENRMPAISANGYDFTVLKADAISSSDESNLYYDRPNRRFIGTVKHGNQWGRAVSLTTSTDFLKWTEPKLIFGADEEDQRRARAIIRNRVANPNGGGPMFVDPEPPVDEMPQSASALVTWHCDVYNMAVFGYQGLYLGLPSIFYRTGMEPPGNNTDGFHEIQLISSRDMQKWDRVGDRKPFIPPSQTDDALLGVYDRNGLFAASPIERGEELWFYYTGIKFRTSPLEIRRDWSVRPREELSAIELADYEEGTGAVCLAVLRKDGFVSLDAGAKGGSVETKPLDIQGEKLFLNVSAAGGEARVAILDESGKPLAGLWQVDCEPVAVDSTRAEVRWKQKDLKSLVGNKARFQVHLKSASLYSIWTE